MQPRCRSAPFPSWVGSGQKVSISLQQGHQAQNRCSILAPSYGLWLGLLFQPDIKILHANGVLLVQIRLMPNTHPASSDSEGEHRTASTL
jgi:hypothetical protein